MNGIIMLRLSKSSNDTNPECEHKFYDFGMGINKINTKKYGLTRSKENPSNWAIGAYVSNP